METVERVSSDDAAEATDAIEDVEIGEVLAESEEDDDSEDSLTYSNGVIEKIVAMATREVPHVLGMKGNLMHLVQETFWRGEPFQGRYHRGDRRQPRGGQHLRHHRVRVLCPRHLRGRQGARDRAPHCHDRP